jgi:hypothetical protein
MPPVMDSAMIHAIRFRPSIHAAIQSAGSDTAPRIRVRTPVSSSAALMLPPISGNFF